MFVLDNINWTKHYFGMPIFFWWLPNKMEISHHHNSVKTILREINKKHWYHFRFIDGWPSGCRNIYIFLKAIQFSYKQSSPTRASVPVASPAAGYILEDNRPCRTEQFVRVCECLAYVIPNLLNICRNLDQCLGVIDDDDHCGSKDGQIMTMVNESKLGNQDQSSGNSVFMNF